MRDDGRHRISQKQGNPGTVPVIGTHGLQACGGMSSSRTPHPADRQHCRLRSPAGNHRTGITENVEYLDEGLSNLAGFLISARNHDEF